MQPHVFINAHNDNRICRSVCDILSACCLGLIFCVNFTSGLHWKDGALNTQDNKVTQRAGIIVSQQNHVTEENNYIHSQEFDVSVYEWGSWGRISSCSRPCGTGVSYRKRHCYKSSGRTQHRTSTDLCDGEDRTYELCNIQNCSLDNTGEDSNFLTKQCSMYDRKPYRGKYYEWKPYHHDQESTKYGKRFGQCSLVCIGENGLFERRIVKLSNRVADGTHCNKHKHLGVCISGKCVTLGCNKVLESPELYDACGVCGGDNSTCNIKDGHIKTNVSMGYTDILSIQEGAQNIKITEISRSSVVFGVRSEEDIYFVNSQHSSRQPTEYSNVGGSHFLYHDPVYAADGREMVEAPGPTNQTLHVMVLCPDLEAEINITYFYTLPNSLSAPRTNIISSSDIINNALQVNVPPESTDKAEFLRDIDYQDNHIEAHWAETNAIENGVQDDYETLYKSHFHTGTDKQTHTKNNQNEINKISYPGDHTPGIRTSSEGYRSIEKIHRYDWKTDVPFSHCSHTCSPGVKTAFARCVRDDDEEVADRYCNEANRPHIRHEHCAGRPCDPRWEASAWSKCSVTCGEGLQYRGVHCWKMLGPGFDSTVKETMCGAKDKPINSRPCHEIDCGPFWETSKWSKCSTNCGDGFQTRYVKCTSDSEPCETRLKPINMRRCQVKNCSSRWRVGEWGECSRGCGWRTRELLCTNEAGNRTIDRDCNIRTKPHSMEACGEKIDCEPVWVEQPWSPCSATCGLGVTYRQVICGQYGNGQFVSLEEEHCAKTRAQPSRARCREKPCQAEWFTSDWSKCSKSCGEGAIQVRKVSCYESYGRGPSLDCDIKFKPPDKQTCRLASCDDAKPESEQECKDTRTDCAFVVSVPLCGHWYYRTACCHSCTYGRASDRSTSRRKASHRTTNSSRRTENQRITNSIARTETLRTTDLSKRTENQRSTNSIRRTESLRTTDTYKRTDGQRMDSEITQATSTGN